MIKSRDVTSTQSSGVATVCPTWKKHETFMIWGLNTKEINGFITVSFVHREHFSCELVVSKDWHCSFRDALLYIEVSFVIRWAYCLVHSMNSATLTFRRRGWGSQIEDYSPDATLLTSSVDTATILMFGSFFFHIVYFLYFPLEQEWMIFFPLIGLALGGWCRIFIFCGLARVGGK